MGSVYIFTEAGELLSASQNSLTEDMETRMLQAFGSGVPNAPTYCAVGRNYAPLIDEPWTRKQLVSEMHRSIISGRFIDPITARAVLLTVFRVQNISTEWREVALFDGDQKVNFGNRARTSCDVIGTGPERWRTGGTNILISDPSGQTEGFGILRVIVPEGGSTTLFETDGVDLNVLGFDTEKARLQLFFSIDRLTDITNIKVEINNRKAGGSNGDYTWTILKADLVDGMNFLDLPFVDAVPTNSPVFDLFEGLSVTYTGSQEDFVCSLDRIRIYQDSGTMLARAELYPVVSKGRQSLIVSWVIEPFSGVA